jgi:hypothetical protein
MTDIVPAYIEERLRIALTGSISSQSMDSFIRTYITKPVSLTATYIAPANLVNFFKTVRPSATPNGIFIAVSEPSICGVRYCCCKSSQCRLNTFKITIFISRREQGRLVTKPWIRASSTEGFENAVTSIMEQTDELLAKAGEGSLSQMKVVSDSETCSVELSTMGSQEV